MNKQENDILAYYYALSFIDSLTGAYNKRYIEQIMPRNTDFWVCMFDVDNFKHINDSIGHVCGDEILKQIANAMKEEIGDEEKLIRFGGDEFVIITQNPDLPDFKKKIEEIRRKIVSICFYRNEYVSVTYGIAGSKAEAPVMDIIRSADRRINSTRRAMRRSSSRYRRSHQAKTSNDRDRRAVSNTQTD